MFGVFFKAPPCPSPGGNDEMKWENQEYSGAIK
jgi:hypothetical protein